MKNTKKASKVVEVTVSVWDSCEGHDQVFANILVNAKTFALTAEQESFLLEEAGADEMNELTFSDARVAAHYW